MAVIGQSPLENFAFGMAGDECGAIIVQGQASGGTSIGIGDTQGRADLDDDRGQLSASRAEQRLIAKELDKEDGAIFGSDNKGAGTRIQGGAEGYRREEKGPQDLTSLVVPHDTCLVLARGYAETRLGIVARRHHEGRDGSTVVREGQIGLKTRIGAVLEQPGQRPDIDV